MPRERSGFELRDDLAVKGIIGLGLPEAIRTLYPEIGDAELIAFREHYAEHYIASEAVPSPLFEGVVESLEAFRAEGYHLAVATGKARRGLDRVLKSHGWENYFDITRAADETASKPHPLMLEQILAHCEVRPEQALMVGDSSFDLQMARNAGMGSVAVSYGAQSIDALRLYRAATGHRPFFRIACLAESAGLTGFFGVDGMTDEWKAPAKASAESGDDKSWKLLEKTLLAGVQEQRRSRRWGIFFKLLTFVYLFGAIALFSPLMDMEKAATLSANYTALIDVTGMIADKEPASADNIVGSLRAAFEDKKVKGVILRINSPGGSPVQSGYVYDEIRVCAACIRTSSSMRSFPIWGLPALTTSPARRIRSTPTRRAWSAPSV